MNVISSTTLSLPGVINYGSKPSKEIERLSCPGHPEAGCLVMDTDYFDLYAATGSAAGQWRNLRTGASAMQGSPAREFEPKTLVEYPDTRPKHVEVFAVFLPTFAFVMVLALLWVRKLNSRPAWRMEDQGRRPERLPRPRA